MNISVHCPYCDSRYFLDPSLRGQKMRCPNSLCRKIFEVREDGEQKPPEAPREVSPATGGQPRPAPWGESAVGRQSTGSVGDLVPMLPAEEVSAPPPAQEPGPQPAPTDPASSPSVGDMVPLISAEAVETKPPPWQEPPPVRKPQAPGQPVSPLPTEAGPAETAPTWQAPPPVRKPTDGGDGTKTPAPEAPSSPHVDTMIPLLQAEAVTRVERPPAPKVPAWQQPPPVRGPQPPGSDSPEAPSSEAIQARPAGLGGIAEPAASPFPGGPVEMGPGAWERRRYARRE